MAWYSILPPELIYVESWAARFFVILGIITIFPWAVLLLFDVSLYLWRTVGYEFPVVGGRARGMQRPRAPSLNERPDGQRRAFGLAGYEDISTATKLDAAERPVKRRTPTDRTEG
ncbi:hypothetical protein P170DRAFT_472734 [Aspergillus steynii IBT 23096]|uniref:Uncharacterized protein n=1 Tax=Aspergillus steynii IBT 23096 TaxID=1392250 RepID=A0A2I2GIY4_9EURO|nr:uncharacterized protein P170DRAFT_472734 [Aspergillus steynii IBT 23096]PLB52841.1 hypothetical protein P170DRAFT_472734 [Aspergillus steynii IBT 23096]